VLAELPKIEFRIAYVVERAAPGGRRVRALRVRADAALQVPRTNRDGQIAKAGFRWSARSTKSSKISVVLAGQIKLADPVVDS